MAAAAASVQVLVPCTRDRADSDGECSGIMRGVPGLADPAGNGAETMAPAPYVLLVPVSEAWLLLRQTALAFAMLAVVGSDGEAGRAG